MRRFLTLLVLGLPMLAGLPAAGQQDAGERFEIEEVVINGLERVSAATVLGRAGFGRGDVVDDAVLARALDQLYETGLFRDLEVSRDGARVIIDAVENPTIRDIRFNGMTELDEDKVLDLLASRDIAPGRIFKRGDDEFIRDGVSSFYRQVSRYLAAVDAVAVPLEDNKVDLVVEVNESEEAKVGQINLHGVSAYPVSDLKNLMELREGGLFMSFFDRDAFKQETFDADLERLRTKYTNDGYVRFEVLSTDVRVDSAAGAIIIDIFISEGARYEFGEPALNDPSGLVPAALFTETTAGVAGQTFNDALVEDTRTDLLSELRDAGYAFAAVNSNVDINDERFRVDVTYEVASGKQVFVREIYFVGNDISRDDSLRANLEIVEGELFSQDKLEYSLLRLRRTSFLLDAQATEIPVGDDQVDIEIRVSENNRGTFLIGVGYSSTDRFSFSVDFKRNNILGSGNDLQLGLSAGKDKRNISAELHEANFTDSGISRTTGVFYSQTDKGATNSNDNEFDRTGVRVDYLIPLNREWSWDAGLEFNNTDVKNSKALADQNDAFFDADGDRNNKSKQFVERYGNSQPNVIGKAALVFDTRDRNFDPTSGTRANFGFSAAVPPGETRYYKFYATSSHYRPLGEDRKGILNFRTAFRYGREYGGHIYPYYERYFLPESSIRGFDPKTAGVKEANLYEMDGKMVSPVTYGDQIGGLFLASAQFDFLRTMDLFDGRSVRAGAYMDVAGLWHDLDQFSSNLGDGYRASAGLILKISTPVFPMSFTYGWPLKKQEGDQIQQFQFRIGI